MRLRNTLASRIVSLILLVLVSLSPVFARTQNAPLPNPVLYLANAEFYMTGGQGFMRYNYQVLNFDAYPNAMFAAAPALPPCGNNHNASRTWVDLYDQRGTRLYGFCNLGKNGDLNGIWFSLKADEIPPSYVYIELTDRQTNTKYKSNLADTTL
jgi:hypothetical protein